MATLEDLIAKYGDDNVEVLERVDGQWLIEVTVNQDNALGIGYIEPTLQEAIDAAARELLR